MSVMQEAAKLRREPNGQPTGVIANLGDEVEALGVQEVDILGSGKESWTKIQLLDADGVPQGWVHSHAVDLAGALDKSIDIHNFARQCWWEWLFSGPNPYDLVAVAESRSKVSNGKDGPNIGPFRLTQGEWDAGRVDPEFKLGAYGERDIADWRMQCVMFGRMAVRAAEGLAKALGRRPNWVELYLAQMIGPRAAAAAIKTPGDKIEKAFENIEALDFPPGGFTRDQLLDRYAQFLRDPQSPETSSTGVDALKRITDDLQAALDIVRHVVDEVANEFFSNETNDERIAAPTAEIPKKTPSAGNIAIPVGDSPAPVDEAGGALGELIAAHESGRAGYGAYNRGTAGATKKPIDFSQMTLQDIMALQAMPPGNPNRLFAVGKYQIIPVTMKGAVSALKIDKTSKLTPRLQEVLFRNYLVAVKRPQIKAYITGKTASLFDAQMVLAFEFASVARPDTGRSNYGGIGGNCASVTAKQTQTALNQERVAFQRLVADGKSADEAWNALSPGI